MPSVSLQDCANLRKEWADLASLDSSVPPLHGDDGDELFANAATLLEEAAQKRLGDLVRSTPELRDSAGHLYVLVTDACDRLRNGELFGSPRQRALPVMGTIEAWLRGGLLPTVRKEAKWPSKFAEYEVLPDARVTSALDRWGPTGQDQDDSRAMDQSDLSRYRLQMPVDWKSPDLKARGRAVKHEVAVYSAGLELINRLGRFLHGEDPDRVVSDLDGEDSPATDRNGGLSALNPDRWTRQALSAVTPAAHDNQVRRWKPDTLYCAVGACDDALPVFRSIKSLYRPLQLLGVTLTGELVERVGGLLVDNVFSPGLSPARADGRIVWATDLRATVDVLIESVKTGTFGDDHGERVSSAIANSAAEFVKSYTAAGRKGPSFKERAESGPNSPYADALVEFAAWADEKASVR